MTQIGLCPLCLFEKPLANSHFFPAAAFRALYAPELPTKQPMVLTRKKIIQSDRQVMDHAFCFDCEQRFNAFGEGWLISKLASLSAFPLRDLLTRVVPAIDEPDFKAFTKISEIAYSKLTHFALGMFWKSSVRDWRIIGEAVPRIRLGACEESIRQFLIGIGRFPADIALVTYLEANSPPVIAAFPPMEFDADGFRLYSFYLNGIQFSMCAGSNIPEVFRMTCLYSASDHPVFVMRGIGDGFVKIAKQLTSGNKPSTRLLRTFEAWKRLKHS
jgi:hypothetical protein